MKRRNFLKKLCSTAGVAVVAPVVIASALDPGLYPGLTLEKLELTIKKVWCSVDPIDDNTFVMYTSRKGYDEFQEALKEYHERQTGLY